MQKRCLPSLNIVQHGVNGVGEGEGKAGTVGNPRGDVDVNYLTG